MTNFKEVVKSIRDWCFPDASLEDLIEKTLVYSYESGDYGRYYSISESGDKVVDFGYDPPTGIEVSASVVAGKLCLLLARGYDSVECQLLDDNATLSTAAEKALEIIENGRNNVMSVDVARSTGTTFGGRQVYRSALNFRYVGKSEDKKKNESLYTTKDEMLKGCGVKPDDKTKKEDDPDNDEDDKPKLDADGKPILEEKKKHFDPSSILRMADGKTEEPFETTFKVIKDALPQGLVYGIVYSPDIEDAHGDFTSKEEIETAAHNFLPSALKNGTSDWTDVNHSTPTEDVEIVESFIAPCNFTYGSGETGDTVQKGSWVLVARVKNVDLKNQILKGEVTGFSLEGTAIKIGD